MATRPGDRRSMVVHVLAAPEDLVLVLQYRDEWLRLSERIVSPVCLQGSGRFLAIDLASGRLRTFYLGRCVDMRFGLAAEVMAPTKTKRGQEVKPLT